MPSDRAVARYRSWGWGRGMAALKRIVVKMIAERPGGREVQVVGVGPHDTLKND